MEAVRLKGLEPASVFACFEKLCSIPHGSRNTKQISDYLVSFCRENGLEVIQDELNNVIFFIPATCGMDSHEPVIIQGHMDMVAEKDADCPIDMAKEGLDVTHDGTCVFARGTTLGGDDGIAVAFAMALALDKTIPHPPVEVIITVDEEIGMEGAAGIDLSGLKGRTLINLDSEDEGIFTVSCAGGVRDTITVPVDKRIVYGDCFRLTVGGLQGGHSGAEIHRNRANANKVMGQLLREIRKVAPVSLVSLSGGSKDNAIPRSCKATVILQSLEAQSIQTVCDELQAKIRADYDEPEAIVKAIAADALGGMGVSSADTDNLIALLCDVPNGVQKWSEHIEGLVQTSLNLGVAGLDDTFHITFSVRSSVDAEKQELMKKLSLLAELHHGTCATTGDYPAWEYKETSRLRDTMVQVYRDMFGKEPQVLAIHAGLECGLLGNKLPGLDCVSVGPQMHDIHTSREKLEIESTRRTWEFFLAVLKAL